MRRRPLSSPAPSRALALLWGLAAALWTELARAEDPPIATPAPAAPTSAAPAEPAAAAPPPIEEKPEDPRALDYDTHRYEPAGFPVLGGDSDIGFQFGGVVTYSKFGGGVRPYIWNIDLFLAVSVKQGPNGAELTQQFYFWDIDVPALAGGKVRIIPAVSYQRTINSGYFGLGNASSPVIPDVVAGAPGRFYQYDAREFRIRELTRIAWRKPWDVMVATTYRYELSHPYEGSRLAQDAAAGVVRGVQNMSVLTAAVGLVYDTRDNEFFPIRGSFHQLGVRAGVGAPLSTDVRYGALGAMLAHYIPLGGKATIAMRGVVDAEYGNIPFFDLFTGGSFQTYQMIGGSAAIRGVPVGRYLGPLKVLGNLELRALLFDVHVLGQTFHLGGSFLFDAGRLWSDYTFKNPADGHGPGIKWGVGNGLFLVWGQAAVFRIEVAYSPDAQAENPRLPLGIYVEDGVMF